MRNNSFDERLREELDKYEQTSGSGSSPQQNKSLVVGTIAGLAVVIFFIAMVICMIKFSKTEPALTVVCLGALFTVFGIVGICSVKINWDNWFVILFPIVGVTIAGLSLAEYFYKKDTGKSILTDNLMVALTAAAFILTGALMNIMPRLKRHFMLKRCTMTVTAKCIYLDMRISKTKHGRSYVYAPKWEYTVDGKVYQHQEVSYSGSHYPHVDDEYEIFVDPDAPETIYRIDPYSMRFMTFMGAAFAGAGLLIIFQTFINI